MKHKVVINNCFGGFGLSEEAIELGIKFTGDASWGKQSAGKIKAL